MSVEAVVAVQKSLSGPDQEQGRQGGGGAVDPNSETITDCAPL